MSRRKSDLANLPSTLPEILAVEREIVALDRRLMEEACELYEAMRRSGSAPAPISEHDRRVGIFLQPYLKEQTPERLIEANVSRDAEIQAHRSALQIVLKELAKRKEAAVYAEAEEFVKRSDKEWRELCREIVFSAHRLHAAEEKARQFLKPIEGLQINGIAMAATIASGVSCLGTGDPLRELREAAVRDGIASEGEIRKARRL